MRALSDQSVIITLANEISIQANQKVQALYQKLKQQPIEGVTAIIPAFTTITIFYDALRLIQCFENKTAIYQ